MSDNSIPAPPGGQQQTPPPAAPIAPAPPAQPYQAYPGAAPSVAAAPQPYGVIAQQPQQPQYSQQTQYSQQPQYGAPTPQPVTGYPVYGAPAYPASRPASGLAITSLICGIAGIVLFWALIPLLASIVAVITGHMALRQTKANPAIGGRGMAFAGLIMGYIMVGFLVLGLVMTVISFVFFGAFTLPFLYSS